MVSVFIDQQVQTGILKLVFTYLGVLAFYLSISPSYKQVAKTESCLTCISEPYVYILEDTSRVSYEQIHKHYSW